jgi:MFS family permease
MNTNSRIEQKQPNSTKEKILDWLSFGRNEFFIVFSMFFFSIANANFIPYAPIWLKQLFDVESFVILGLTNVIYNAMLAVGTLLWGFFADKFGTKKFIIGGLIAMGLMYISLIFSMSPVYFLVIILVGYFFGSAQQANYYAFATVSTIKSKEMILGKISAIMSFAWIIMSPISGTIHDIAGDNAMMIQLIIAIISISIALILILFSKETRIKDIEVKNKEVNSSKSISVYPIFFGLILIWSFFMQATMSGFWAYSSIYFIETLSVKAVHYSLFLIATTTLAIPVSIILGNIKSNRKISEIAIVYLLIQALCYLFMSIFYKNSTLNLILYSIPMYPFYSVSVYTLIANYSNKERRAAAYGIFSFVGITGVVVGILLLGVLADNSPLGIFVMLRYTFLFAVISFIFAIAVFLLIRRRKNKEEGILL